MNANVPPEMIRQGPMRPNPSMLGPNPPFMQNPPQSGQQALGHMGLPPAAAGSSAPMSMLANNSQNAARFPQMQQPGNMQPPPQQQVRMSMARTTPGGQHMNSIAASQLQNQLFHQNNMSQAGPNLGPRRGPSQPPPAGHMAGLSPNNINLTMNPQNPMQPHLRPGQQQNPQGMQPPMGGVPDMALVMARQGSNGNNHMIRTGSAMGALNPTQVGFSPGMQTSHSQNSMQNPSQIPPNQLPITSPRPGSHPQPHNPSVPMATSGPSQTPVNRRQMTPENPMLNIGFSNSQFPPGPSGSRMPNNGQFSFPSSNSPIQMSDVPSPMPGSMANTTSGTPTRGSFQLTPAQQLGQMNPSDSYPFNLPPSRPQSQHNPHSSVPQQPPFPPPIHRQSPRPNDPHVTHPQRPSSQPQQIIPVRPPSQSAPHTPSQASINVNATVAGTRISVAPGGAQPPHTASGAGPTGVVPQRPAQQPIAPPGAPSGPAPSLPSADGPSTNPMGMPLQPNSIPQIESGQGIQRLLQFSSILANESPNKLQLSWWQECIKEYFTPSAIMKITLWKDNQRTEAKPFDIGVPILPRFFLVTTQSGVRSMSLALDGAREKPRERPYARNAHHCIIECHSAIWTYKYNNGYTVTLRGPLTAHIVISQPTISTSDSISSFHGGQRHLKFEHLQFEANQHDKYILLDTVMRSRLSGSPRIRNELPTMNGMAIQQQQLDDERKWEEPRIMIERSLIPGEPVNAFGIPQATMRCLELAESVGQMSELIAFSTEYRLGPIDSLRTYAAQLREKPTGLFNSVLSTGNPGSTPNTYPFIPSTGGTLYSSAPASVTNPQANPSTSTSSLTSTQNTPSSASNSPQKQHQTIPQQQQQSQGSSASSAAPAASPTISSGATTNTPHMMNSNLKRKQTDVASPTISNPDQPPAKRSQRKRGRTAGGG